MDPVLPSLMNAQHIETIRNEIANGNTTRVRRAVRDALRTQVLAAMRSGFSAHCDPDNLTYLVFVDGVACAGAEGFLRCCDHTFTCAIPFSDIV